MMTNDLIRSKIISTVAILGKKIQAHLLLTYNSVSGFGYR